jgi:hypothetical protein
VSGTGDLDLTKHPDRASRHRVIGDLLAEAGDEWAAVPLFYSAYHFVRHALRSDPIFLEPTWLSRVHVSLTMAERDVTRHKGRKFIPGSVGREWGINELVTLLYRPLTISYEKLHQASIEVRYGAGLKTAPLPGLVEALDRIQTAHAQGTMVASHLCPALRATS